MQWGKTENFSSEVRKKTRMPVFAISIQHYIAVLTREIKQEKKEKPSELEKKK